MTVEQRLLFKRVGTAKLDVLAFDQPRKSYIERVFGVFGTGNEELEL